MLKANETVEANLRNPARFAEVYLEPIRAAVAALRFVDRDEVDDVVNEFFVKVYEKKLLERWHAEKEEKGKSFRKWLYTVLKNHAMDRCRRDNRIRNHIKTLQNYDIADPRAEGDGEEHDPDSIYALSILQIATQRVREYWLDHAKKAEVWDSFEELYLRRLVPDLDPEPEPRGQVGRPPAPRTEKERKENQRKYNQATSVMRVFRRVLPEVIPVGLCERPDPEERFKEWLAILCSSKSVRRLPVWLAFLDPPRPTAEMPSGQSGDLAAWVRDVVGDPPRTTVAPGNLEAAEADKLEPWEVARRETADRQRWEQEEWESAEGQSDELRVLLAFWIGKPLRDYIERDFGSPAVKAPGVGQGAHPGKVVTVPPFSLRSVIEGVGRPMSGDDLESLLREVKSFAKRTFQMAKAEAGAKDLHEGLTRWWHAMPVEVAHVLYNLAAALSLARHGRRIDSLRPDQIRNNFNWVLERPWMLDELRPVFVEALKRLDPMDSDPVME